jgi:hypothetical protein
MYSSSLRESKVEPKLVDVKLDLITKRGGERYMQNENIRVEGID